MANILEVTFLHLEIAFLFQTYLHFYQCLITRRYWISNSEICSACCVGISIMEVLFVLLPNLLSDYRKIDHLNSALVEVNKGIEKSIQLFSESTDKVFSFSTSMPSRDDCLLDSLGNLNISETKEDISAAVISSVVSLDNCHVFQYAARLLEVDIHWCQDALPSIFLRPFSTKVFNMMK